MLLFNVGDESNYLNLDKCMRDLHNKTNELIKDAIDIRKKAGADLNEGFGEISELGKYKSDAKLKSIKIKIRAVSAADYYKTIVNMDKNLADFDGDFDEFNKFKTGAQKEFIKKSLVSARSADSKVDEIVMFEDENLFEKHLQIFEDNHLLTATFTICRDYQNLNAEEKKRFGQ